MNQDYTEYHAQNDEELYHVETNEVESVDLEQVNQFQSEAEPRSTATAMTDLYASSQIESHRHFRDQGDPNEYSPRFEDQ